LASKWIRKRALSKLSISGCGLLRVDTGLELASKKALLDFVAVGVVRIERALGLQVGSQEGTGVLGLKWLLEEGAV